MAGGDKHPGMMGDGTEEQNLAQRGNPDARIGKDEVEKAFGKDKPAPKTGETGSVTDQVSNDVSDAKQTPEDSMPKDNSHNFN